MITYKIDIAAALNEIGFNVYRAKATGFLSQDTLKKLKSHDTRVSLDSINRLCTLLDMRIEDVIEFEMSPQDKEKRESVLTAKKRKE